MYEAIEKVLLIEGLTGEDRNDILVDAVEKELTYVVDDLKTLVKNGKITDEDFNFLADLGIGTVTKLNSIDIENGADLDEGQKKKLKKIVSDASSPKDG